MIRRRRAQQRLLKLVFLLLMVVIGGGLVWAVTHSKKVQPQKEDPLKVVADSVLQGKDGTYGVVIKNLKTGETYTYNKDKYFATGSLYKLWVMATAVQQLQKGTMHDDEQLTEDVADLNDEFNIASEDAELTDGTISLSVNDALTQMITISHNYAALLLTKKIGEDTISHFLIDNKLEYSHLGGNDGVPAVTPEDVALFLEKLYNGKLGNPSSTNKMLDLLKGQQLNGKLPKYLPSDVVIAHKTGELGLYSHDAGIVYIPNGPYIIVVLTKTNNPDNANDVIGQLSKVVYDYFSKGGGKHE